jgi:hypothetical protein
MAEYIEYHPLKFWLDPASIAEIVAHIQTYLVNNPINSTTEIETIIHDYLIAHPEIIGGVRSINGETGEVILTADNISGGENVTIKDVLDSLQDQIDDIVASIPSDYQQLIDDVSDLKSNLNVAELATVKTAEPIVTQWKQKSLNSNTGAESAGISAKSISTWFYPLDEKTSVQFTGVIRGEDETADRQIYTYCYSADKAYLGRTNRQLLAGTKFVRFLYGFLSASPLTVDSYGFDNLVADWSMSFDIMYDNVINAYDGDISNFETTEWFERQLDVSDFLKFEKTACLHHDNFARANNSTDIGYNGTDQTVYNVLPYKMEYGTMSVGTGNLNVGISNNRAVGSGGSTGDTVIKTVDAVNYPYKVIVSALTEGELAVGAISASEFVSVVFGANSVSLVNNGSKEIWLTRNTIHNSGVSGYSVYVYKNRIAVYNCGVKMFEAPADMQSTVCGIVFRRAKNSTYKYTCFDVFNPSEWMQDGLNPATEQYALSQFNVSSDVETRNANALRTFGQLQTATTYGITLDTDNTLRSKRSMRFELRYGDPIVSSGARSEIVPIRPKGNEITLHSKILDFDIMFGDDYDSDTGEDIIMQMHDLPDGVNMAGLSPGIALKVISNVLYLSTMGAGIKVLTDSDRPTQKLTQIATVEKNVWHHVTVYLREGYMELHNPVTAVWYDGELKTIDYGLNCYNEARGSYPKFGIYKSWMHGATQTEKRTLWIDNINLWY